MKTKMKMKVLGMDIAINMGVKPFSKKLVDSGGKEKPCEANYIRWVMEERRKTWGRRRRRRRVGAKKGRVNNIYMQMETNWNKLKKREREN